MTKLEREVITGIVGSLRNPSVPGTEYDFSKGGLGRVELNSTQEVNRLFESEDFRKGWELCHEAFRERLAALPTLSAKDLKAWLRYL